MIISRTPFRISFFGGGTDYPEWSEKFGGQVLSTTINKYCYITIRYLPPFFDHKYRIVYSKIEDVKKVEEISHPSVRETLKWLKVNQGIELHHDGDLPARSGLGSSSTFTVGLLNAIYALKDKNVSKEKLAKEAIYVERHLLNENVGVQDQIIAALGGLKHIVINKSGEFDSRSVNISDNFKLDFEKSLLLFFSGIVRTASEIAKEQISRINENKKFLEQIHTYVDECLELFKKERFDVQEFGNLIHESWIMKKSLAQNISNSKLDQIYEIAMNNGAIGGKVLGAGGGGFMLFVAPPEKHSEIIKALPTLINVPIRFENSGSQIIFKANQI